jgi:hypothetical protein
MSVQAKHQVKIAEADKTQATALALEFWTSKGFKVYSDSYNCIVLRRNDYGTMGKLFSCIIGDFASEEETSFDQAPVELTVLCQILPNETKWDLEFKLAYYVEKTPGDFSRVSQVWCNEFASFCREWMKSAI